MSNFLDGLNEEQMLAVTSTEGAYLVLAGAGSGKTKVLTTRIAFLINQGIQPWNILSVTFTNKAAKEMKERLIKLSGPQANDVWSGTFHSICIRILSQNGHHIGLDKFTIVDDKERAKVIKEAMALVGVNYDEKVMLSMVSDSKNKLLTPDDMAMYAKFQHEKDFANVYQVFEEKMRDNDYIDFDDCILKTVKLLENNQEVCSYYQNKFQYIHTDETQDTNEAQFKLLMLLNGENGNMFAVGDIDQSIYRFRGAQIANILNFNQFFPESKTIILKMNYRSTANIVNASNTLISYNSERVDKVAVSAQENGSPIYLMRADTDDREASMVVSTIERLRRTKGYRYGDFSILYRSNAQSRVIESMLAKEGIPYQVVSGTSFYDRKEIKDIIAYLRTVNNEMDQLAFDRIINVPKRGIGQTTSSRILSYAQENGLSFYTALKHVKDIPKISKKALAAIQQFVTLIESYREFSESEEFKVAPLIYKILKETGYLQLLQESGKEEDEDRIANLEELLLIAEKWDEESDSTTLNAFLTETSLTSDTDDMEEGEMVTLMTVHASKGLEFPVVFVVGLEEGTFPHSRSLKESDAEAAIEEERRLMYVAMTRAETNLFITFAQKRAKYGKGYENTRPSRFLKEIPRELVVSNIKKK